MLAIVLACVAMALKDAVTTFLVVAESRGRAVLAGLLDAASDLATILVTLAGAGAIIIHGWSAHTIEVLTAMMLTSFTGTVVWTYFAAQWVPHEKPSVD